MRPNLRGAGVTVVLAIALATILTYLVEIGLAAQSTPIRGTGALVALLLGLGIVWFDRRRLTGGLAGAAQPHVAEPRSIWGEIPHVGPRPRVSVVIPALNEERNLAHVASRMPRDVDEIVMVDGDSIDKTVEVARQLWPDAVHIDQTRAGKGNALACGIAAASGDIIVLIDADGSTDPAEIPRYVAALVGGADYAKGSRFIRGGGSDDITAFRRIGNLCLNGVVNLLFSARFTDLCYGYNAFWRPCLEVMRLPDINAPLPQRGDGFEVEALINVRVAASHLTIAEVCSYEKARIHGSSNLRAISDGMRVLKTICIEFMSARPAKAPVGVRSPATVGEAAA